jgi:plasmid stabilization system protein ParE
MHVVITADAEADLDDIFDYVAEDSPTAAFGLVATLRAKALRIGLAPRAYPARSNYGNGIRVTFSRSYVILFRIEPDRVEILHIVHGARDLKRLFDE